MLTKKQHELLAFIYGWSQKSGVSPSFDEMKEALNLKSKSGVHRLITGLEERGFIRRLAHRARAIEILRLPDGSRVDNAAPTPEPAWQGEAEIVAGPFGGRQTPRAVVGGAPVLRGRPTPRQDETSIALPVHGKIAAGTPIDALSNPHRSVDVPLSMLGRGEYYALEVDGDSMIEDGIMDGDTVVIERCQNAENGAVIVALVDDQEATLKRLRRRGDSVALEPANQHHKIQVYGADRVKIQGRLIGLFRRY